MVRAVSLNVEQRLYVIPCGEGFTCFGFDNCMRESKALAQKMGYPEPAPELAGTLELYTQYLGLVDIFRHHKSNRDTWFAPDTDPKVEKILEARRKDSAAIRIFLGDRLSGRDWCCEWDVVGIVGRSMGPMRVPLLVQPGEDGGGAISTDSILRIMDVRTNKEIYRHPLYQVPNLRIAVNVEEKHPDLRWAGFKDEKLEARFKSMYEAAEWLAYMTGEKAATDEQLRALYGNRRLAA